MLQILQTDDCEKYYPIALDFGISTSEMHVVEAIDNELVIAFGIFHYKDNSVAVDYIETDDTDLFDGIMRSILFIALNKGKDNVFFNISDKDGIDKMNALHFPVNSSVNISELFELLKKCK